MVEIALCLAIIGFAMVAIIGVLPTGVRVQQDNREETIINEDGLFLVEAIRSGSRGLDYLTNYVDSITITNSLRQSTQFTYAPVDSDTTFSNGSQILGLLTTPRFVRVGGVTITNSTSMIMRSLSGSALMQSRESRDFAFTYRVVAEMIPMSIHPASYTNYLASGLLPDELTARSNNWRVARSVESNFHELRLTLQWPVFQQGNRLQIGSNRKTLRTLVNGLVAGEIPEGLYHVNPSRYGRVF